MKINKKMRRIEVFLIAGILVIMLCSLVSAFGVAFPDGSPLEMYPGETKDVRAYLGSAPTEGNLIIKAEIADDAGIASLMDRDLEYEVNSGEEVPVNIKMNMGEDAVVGEEYTVVLKFSDITPSEEGGMISIKSYSTNRFDVKVVERPPEEKPEKIGVGWMILVVILVVVAIAIIWLVAKKKIF